MNPRTDTLNQAEQLINGDRNNQYGPPNQDFGRTAQLWTNYLSGRTHLEAHDVATMMILLKISRIRWSPENHDHWIDIAGYAACGWDSYTSNEPPYADQDPHETYLRYQETISELEETINQLKTDNQKLVRKTETLTGKTMRKIAKIRPNENSTKEEWAEYYDSLPSYP